MLSSKIGLNFAGIALTNRSYSSTVNTLVPSAVINPFSIKIPSKSSIPTFYKYVGVFYTLSSKSVLKRYLIFTCCCHFCSGTIIRNTNVLSQKFVYRSTLQNWSSRYLLHNRVLLLPYNFCNIIISPTKCFYLKKLDCMSLPLVFFLFYCIIRKDFLQRNPSMS